LWYKSDSRSVGIIVHTKLITARPFSPPPPSGSTLTVPSIKETYIINGGTGRFKRATGKFTVERLVDFVDADMDFAFTGGVIVGGTITFPNAENAQ
jgi:hypothetical protein